MQVLLLLQLLLFVLSITSSFTHPPTSPPLPQVGKVSVRFVPDQEPGALVELLTAHINHEFAKLRSPNTCSVAVRWVGAALLLGQGEAVASLAWLF